MSINWTFNPSEYKESSFGIVPVGDHRVRIEDVAFKTFKSGNDGFEITLAVAGHSSKLWHYLVLKHDDPQKTNQSIGAFFDSFGITDYDLSHFRGWIGKVGAVRVKHESYQGNVSAKVAFCLSKKTQEKLDLAQFSGAAATAAVSPVVVDSELPF